MINALRSIYHRFWGPHAEPLDDKRACSQRDRSYWSRWFAASSLCHLRGQRVRKQTQPFEG